MHRLCDDPLGCAPTFEQQVMAIDAACTCLPPDASGAPLPACAGQAAEQEVACDSSCEYCGHHPFVLDDFCDPTQVPGLCGGGG